MSLQAPLGSPRDAFRRNARKINRDVRNRLAFCEHVLPIPRVYLGGFATIEARSINIRVSSHERTFDNEARSTSAQGQLGYSGIRFAIALHLLLSHRESISNSWTLISRRDGVFLINEKKFGGGEIERYVIARCTNELLLLRR